MVKDDTTGEVLNHTSPSIQRSGFQDLKEYLERDQIHDLYNTRR